MPWDKPPSIAGRATLIRIVDELLYEGSHRIAAALARGTPVDTGLTRDSWTVEPDGPHEWIVVNRTPYFPYVKIDNTEAEAEAADLSRRVGDAAQVIFGG